MAISIFFIIFIINGIMIIMNTILKLLLYFLYTIMGLIAIIMMPFFIVIQKIKANNKNSDLRNGVFNKP